VNGEGRVREDVGLWLRLLGFALAPLAVQVLQPAIGGLLSILTPLPLAYGMSRRGYLEGSAAVAFVALLTAMVAGTSQGLFFLIETIPLCVGIRWAALSRAPLERSVIIAAALVVITVLVSVVVYSVFSGKGPVEIYTESVQRMGIVMDNVSEPSGVDQEEMRQFQQWMTNILLKLVTGIWISTLIFLVTFYTLLIRGWLAAAGLVKLENLSLLSTWALPFPFVLTFILLASVVVFTEGLPKDAALNMLLPLGTLYGIQGVIVTGHMFTRWALPSFFRALFLAFGIITFPVVFMISIALIGLFDTWIDFRRRWPLKETPAPPTI
jgi:hypothetical protein